MQQRVVQGAVGIEVREHANSNVARAAPVGGKGGEAVEH